MRDQLIYKWNETQQHHTLKDTKRVYYLSMEFLMGRSLNNVILNLGLKDTYSGKLLQLNTPLSIDRCVATTGI